MKTLCIYHGNCDDGFAAAWVIRQALGQENVEFYPGVYQKDPPDVIGRDVIMVDFSYKRPVIESMAAKVSTLLILDHHKTAAIDLAGFPPPLDGRYNPSAMLDWQRENNAPTAVHVLFDMNRSGAGIAWDYFNPGKARPPFIDYIEDRDLWKKQLEGGDEFTIALRSWPQTVEAWEHIAPLDCFGHDVKALICQGSDIQRYYRCRVEELKDAFYMAHFGEYLVPVANAPYFAASEVAGELAEGNAFAACFFQRADGRWQYSLRSRADGIDVGEFAKRYGGGGHRGAAGFAVAEPVHHRVAA